MTVKADTQAPSTTFLLLVGMMLVFLVGCGTVVDLVGHHMDGPHVYGGVRLYIHGHPFHDEAYWWPLAVLAYLIDLPLSAVADTVILPFTVPYELSRSQNK